jgi:hypothetical protein
MNATRLVNMGHCMALAEDMLRGALPPLLTSDKTQSGLLT